MNTDHSYKLSVIIHHHHHLYFICYRSVSSRTQVMWQSTYSLLNLSILKSKFSHVSQLVFLNNTLKSSGYKSFTLNASLLVFLLFDLRFTGSHQYFFAVIGSQVDLCEIYTSPVKISKPGLAAFKEVCFVLISVDCDSFMVNKEFLTWLNDGLPTQRENVMKCHV